MKGLNKIKYFWLDGLLGSRLELGLFRVLSPFYKIIIRIYILLNPQLTRKKTILFINGVPTAELYACNIKYIQTEFLKQNINYDYLWAKPFLGSFDRKVSINLPATVSLIDLQSIRGLFRMMTASVIIINNQSIISSKVLPPKRKNQIYIQTWHGSLGIKRFAIRKNNQTFTHPYIRMNYLISNSSFEEYEYDETLWPNTPCLRYGHARNDLFFQSGTHSKLHTKVNGWLDISTKVKIVLYAPTFRDCFLAAGDDESIHTIYGIDYAKLTEALGSRFGGEWVVILRFHPAMSQHSHQIIKNHPSIIDGCKYPDMQHLLLRADAVITDYSSCIYDFMLSRKPGFIFAADQASYNNERGLFYPLESTPFPVSSTDEELITSIIQFDEKQYAQRVEEFLTNKGCMEDGLASVRTVAKICELLDGTPMPEELKIPLNLSKAWS